MDPCKLLWPGQAAIFPLICREATVVVTGVYQARLSAVPVQVCSIQWASAPCVEESWIPACAGMTVSCVGMTGSCAGMTLAGMTLSDTRVQALDFPSTRAMMWSANRRLRGFDDARSDSDAVAGAPG